MRRFTHQSLFADKKYNTAAVFHPNIDEVMGTCILTVDGTTLRQCWAKVNRLNNEQLTNKFFVNREF